MIDINWNPTRRDLRSFGWIALVGFGLIGGLLRFKGLETASLVLWILAGSLGLLGTVVPSLLRPVYLVWMALAWPIGWVVSHILLGLVFYLLFSLVGLVFRVLGRDPMDRSLRPGDGSYWSARPQNGPEQRSRYFRQF